MEKINFSGGEPFLPQRGRHLGEMVKFCKKELKLPSVTIISNGSLIKEKWLQEYGEFVDILAISCDSFNEDTNKVRDFLDSFRIYLVLLKIVIQVYKLLFSIQYSYVIVCLEIFESLGVTEMQ